MVTIIETITENILIGQIQFFEEQPNICLREAYEISKYKNGYRLISYPTYAKENSVFIKESSVFTMYEPNDKLLELYYSTAKKLYLDEESPEDNEIDALSILDTLYD
jgi:small nuclear ribonucleoprotein (snRNP)-like protein